MRTLYDHKDILDAVDMWGKLLEARITSLEELMAKTFAEVLADVDGVKAKVVENTDQTVALFGQAGTLIEAQSALIAALKEAVTDLSKRVATDAEQADFAAKLDAFNAEDARIDAAKADFAAKLTANPVN